MLSRADKKSVKAQLSLLRTLNNYANKHDYLEVPQKVSELVREFLPSYPADIAQSAQKLILEQPSGGGAEPYAEQLQDGTTGR